MPCPNCGGSARYVNPDMDGNYAYAECRGHIKREGVALLKKRPDEKYKRMRNRIQYSKPPCGWTDGKIRSGEVTRLPATVVGEVKEANKEAKCLTLSDYRSG